MARPQTARTPAGYFTKVGTSHREPAQEALNRADCSNSPEIGQTRETGRKPVGTPQHVFGVFLQDKSYYVKVAVHRVYEATDFPPRTVREFLPHVFEVGEFKRTFSSGEHGLVMDQINEKIAELESHNMRDKAKAVIWKQRLSEWLGHFLVCVPSKSPTIPREADTERCKSIASSGGDSKTCSDGSLANHKACSRNS